MRREREDEMMDLSGIEVFGGRREEVVGAGEERKQRERYVSNGKTRRRRYSLRFQLPITPQVRPPFLPSKRADLLWLR